MPVAQTVEHPNFDTVWAALMENREQLKETERIIKESQKEVAERQKETDRIVKETAKQIGKLNNRFGEIVEYMVAPNLREKFRDLGLKFHQANPNAVFYDDNNNTLFEVDVFLQNGDKAMLVEVKTALTTDDIKDHIVRLEKMRIYADLHGDKRAFLGAVAGIVMTINVKEYALRQGFYVIEPSGETFNIIPPSGKEPIIKKEDRKIAQK
jgi:hypothetical protein